MFSIESLPFQSSLKMQRMHDPFMNFSLSERQCIHGWGIIVDSLERYGLSYLLVARKTAYEMYYCI